MQPPELARERRILDVLYRDLGDAGVVPGPEAAVIYLTLISRHFDRPVCIVLKGASAVGKTYIVLAVATLVQPDAYVTFTAMSERALVYSEDSFVHRVLIVYEAEGIATGMGAYIVRSLVSEGRINYQTVVTTPKGPRGMRITKGRSNGPDPDHHPHSTTS